MKTCTTGKVKINKHHRDMTTYVHVNNVKTL